MTDAAALGRPRYSSVARPAGWLVGLGAFIALLAVVAGLSVASAGGWSVVIGAALLVGLMLLAWVVARGAVRVTVTDSAIHVSYPLATRTISMIDVTDVGAGDHVNGFGYGWGVRWEGRGKWAYRVGGPMATVVHKGGRIGLSVEDPHAFVEAVMAARGHVA